MTTPSLFESLGGGKINPNPLGTIPGTKSLDSLMKQGIAEASSAANNPTNNFFSNDPYSQYKVFLGADIGPIGVVPKSQLGYGMTGYTDYQSAVLAPTSWDANKLREFVNKGIVNKIPGFEVGMGMPQIQSAWQDMVRSSVLFNLGIKGNQKPWTPMDVMDSWSSQKGKYGTQRQGDWVFDVATGERIKYVGPTSKTTTSKQIDLSSPEEAQALVTQVLQQALGRAPTPKELAKFRSTISGYEKANPTVTTTTQQLSPDLSTGQVDVTSQSSTTAGGVSDAARAALVQNPTVETKEYGKYQAGTTYYNALMQMIGGG
jgi:hypothetical protein